MHGVTMSAFWCVSKLSARNFDRACGCGCGFGCVRACARGGCFALGRTRAGSRMPPQRPGGSLYSPQWRWCCNAPTTRRCCYALTEFKNSGHEVNVWMRTILTLAGVLCVAASAGAFVAQAGRKLTPEEPVVFKGGKVVGGWVGGWVGSFGGVVGGFKPSHTAYPCRIPIPSCRLGYHRRSLLPHERCGKYSMVCRHQPLPSASNPKQRLWLVPPACQELATAEWMSHVLRTRSRPQRLALTLCVGGLCGARQAPWVQAWSWVLCPQPRAPGPDCPAWTASWWASPPAAKAGTGQRSCWDSCWPPRITCTLWCLTT